MPECSHGGQVEGNGEGTPRCALKVAQAVETLSRPTSSQKHEDEAWRIERLMFWRSEDQQLQVFQEVFKKEKRLDLEETKTIPVHS